jgi:hypothetical protein
MTAQERHCPLCDAPLENEDIAYGKCGECGGMLPANFFSGAIEDGAREEDAPKKFRLVHAALIAGVLAVLLAAGSALALRPLLEKIAPELQKIKESEDSQTAAKLLLKKIAANIGDFRAAAVLMVLTAVSAVGAVLLGIGGLIARQAKTPAVTAIILAVLSPFVFGVVLGILANAATSSPYA